MDGPSGLDYGGGALDELALPADLMVTFAYPKPGHFRFPDAGALGELIVADIGVAPGRHPHCGRGPPGRGDLPIERVRGGCGRRLPARVGRETGAGSSGSGGDGRRRRNYPDRRLKVAAMSAKPAFAG